MKIKHKYSHSPLEVEYLKKINELPFINLIILGKDPYPTGASNIPFVKDTWDDLKADSAGHNVFQSLVGESFKDKFSSPRDLAFDLLARNIVLLNCSYHLLNGEKISQTKHFTFISSAFEINLPILQKAKKVLMCGDAAKMIDMVADYDESIFEKVPHPSGQSRNGAEDKTVWTNVWSTSALNRVAGGL